MKKMEIIEKTFIVIGGIILILVGMIGNAVFIHCNSIVISQDVGNIVCQKLLNNTNVIAIDKWKAPLNIAIKYPDGSLICKLKTPTNDYTNLIQVIK